MAPESYEQQRQNTVDRTNPIPYNSMYFRHKLHIDQNEKLIYDILVLNGLYFQKTITLLDKINKQANCC